MIIHKSYSISAASKPHVLLQIMSVLVVVSANNPISYGLTLSGMIVAVWYAVWYGTIPYGNHSGTWVVYGWYSNTKHNHKDR